MSNLLFRACEKEEFDEIYRRIDKGGVLYLIERTDTNQYAYSESLPDSSLSNSPNFGQSYIIWANDVSISFFMATGMFLTKGEAEKYNEGFTEGGCHCCGHGSTKIKTIVTEHEFVRRSNRSGKSGQPRKRSGFSDPVWNTRP